MIRARTSARIYLVVSVLALALVLTACGGSGSRQEDEARKSIPMAPCAGTPTLMCEAAR